MRVRLVTKNKVLCGADRFDDLMKLIKGRRCGLLTSASGVDSEGVPTYCRLHESGCLTVMFSPEHGIHSVMQDGCWEGHYIDKETGLPVYNLPSGGNPDIDRALSLCDAVVYDVQDVGARFYTYIYCLTYLMKECAARKIPVIVLDRPNPISGSMSAVSGAVLDEERFSSFIGRYAIPVRYSMTCGEFARYANEEKFINCKLSVLECKGWSRSMYGDETGLPWVNPSPNIPSIDTAINYIGTCLIEATNVSEGRGTTRPFEVVGAPFVDSAKLLDMMKLARLEGVSFSRSYFSPMFGKWKGEVCEGVQLNITDRTLYDPHLCGLYLLYALRSFSGFEWRENGICLRYGRDTLTKNETFSPEEVVKGEAAGIKEYVESVSKYLLYR